MAPATSTREPIDLHLMDIVHADTRKWYQKRNLRFLYFILVPTCIGTEWTLGFDGSIMNNLQAVPSWLEYFNNPSSGRLGLLNAIHSLGMVMAVPFEPRVSQWLGRRWTIAFGSGVMWLGAGIQAGARNTDIFLASRWLLGFGILFVICEASALIGELAYAKERATMTSLFSANYWIGSIIASGVTTGTFAMESTWGWRIPSLLQAVFSAIQVVFLPFCPESPRWLISHGRGADAYEILQKYHSEGVEGDEYVRREYAQIQASLKLERELAKRFLWADVFRDKAMFHRFAVSGLTGVFGQTSGNGLITYYFAKVLRTVGVDNNRTIQQIILSNNCWGLINSVPLSIIAPRYPRRHMFILGALGMAACFTAWTVASARYETSASSSAAAASIAFVFLYNPYVYPFIILSSPQMHPWVQCGLSNHAAGSNSFLNIGLNALAYTYIVELFPYTQRSQGLAFKQLIGRLGNFFNAYVNPIALDAIGWKYYIFYCVWLVAQAGIVFLVFPETHNASLEDLSFLLEGEEVGGRMRRDVQGRLGGDGGGVGGVVEEGRKAVVGKA
ncbi:MFS general substrate transporter [Bimuria novae-zelandiae CBS 107.79]|uniref:MFS general substrate transporter n=1 Tax=Bimuria novae-zelandiae CBS 107.79 TaxID=1447943 RepID=A0A6A5VMB6_9PLEO|nr:MFS general substrate transporter [Bimuria novae-zelandiae CBS 107.79]